MTREVESLVNVSWKDGKYDEAYENEASLIEAELGLPPAFMGLGTQEQQMILLYLDDDIVETSSQKKTKGNVFASFLMTYPNKTLLSKIFVDVEIPNGTNADGSVAYKYIKQVDDEYMPQYLRLKAMSSAVWKNNNLKELIKSMREIIENGGFKDEEMIERVIVDDALSNDKSNYTARMRSLAVKIKGMEKTNALQQVNVYVKGGGRELNRTIIESSGNDNYDLGLDVND